MYKFIILLRLLTTDTHIDVFLKDGQKLTLQEGSPDYEFCADYLAYSLEDNVPIGVIINEQREILHVIPSETGVVSSFYTDEADKLGIAMMPLAGIYRLSKRHPQYERLRLLLVDSQQRKKKVDIFIGPPPATTILDVRFAQ